MARTKAVLSAGARLSDHLSASLLARVFPAAMINEILDQHGCNSQRIRSLPAVSGVYLCMAMSLYPDVAYEHIYTVLSQGLSWMQGGTSEATIAKSSISEMRAKLGAAPLQTLIERACVPLSGITEQPEAFYAGLRLVAIDGSNLEVADEPDNVEAFGYPGSRTGHAGYPQAQCAILVECASHAILATNLGAYRTSEWEICQPLLSRLDASMLCLADRGFNGYAYWAEALATGAQLLWRCTNHRQLPVVEPLEDGSYLSVIYPSRLNSKKKKAAASDLGITVRVIDYSLPEVNGAEPRYRLITSLLDDKTAPALELAALYHQRWQVEAVFDELKVHLRHNRRVLRSKKAELVKQEFYGWVLAHYAVRWLMHQAAHTHRQREGSLSFTGHVQLIRNAQPQSGAFPPQSSPENASGGLMRYCLLRQSYAASPVGECVNRVW